MRLLLDHLPLKLISLGLAILLWYVIAGEKTSEMGLSVPVELQNFPRDLELTGDPTNEVEVRLRASPGIIQRLGPGDISARIDVTGAVEGERIVHLTGDSIRVPFGVQVVKVNPAIITLNFERTLEKTVPVRPRLLGRPAAGFEVAESTANPADVQVVGPKSRVHDMESAYRVSDRIAMLYDGRVLEEGRPAEIRKSENPIVRGFMEGKPELVEQGAGKP